MKVFNIGNIIILTKKLSIYYPFFFQKNGHWNVIEITLSKKLNVTMCIIELLKKLNLNLFIWTKF